MKPGPREIELVRSITALIVAYFAKPTEPRDRVMVVRMLTSHAGPLHACRARDFASKIDINCLIA